ncbi:MAG: hypothetical protein OXU20_40150 [Myxococcales bacterium]|nr:hypothetical protein [Myxococcales bacterium]
MLQEHRQASQSGCVLATLTLVALGGCSVSQAEGDEVVSNEVSVLTQALTIQELEAACQDDPRVRQGQVSVDVCVGAELFFRDDFAGNGRTCGSCHPAGNNYTIDPTFIATVPSSDPLFVSEQAPALANLEVPALMRDFGLIVENVDGFEDPTRKFVMRSVPHCFSLSTSGVAQGGLGVANATGWSGDGAPNGGAFRDFQTGAITQHYPLTLDRTPGTDFELADNDELDAIEAFLLTIGRENELDLTEITLTDAGAEAGRDVFVNSRCNGCHRNAGANVGSGVNVNFDTGVEAARLTAVDALGIMNDGGFGNGPAVDLDNDGIFDPIGDGKFNTTPLIEAADTGPFFHTNHADTIEESVAFYISDEFKNSPTGGTPIATPFGATEIQNVARFLRVLNAEFNIQLAITRAEAALPIIVADKNESRDLQQGMAALALAEVEDALEVLSGQSNLNVDVQDDLSDAEGFLDTASTHASHTQRRRAIDDALAALAAARIGLSSTPSELEFVMGEGTLMF